MLIFLDHEGAEYGEFSGGQIEVVTKSGTNTLHGDEFEFMRNTDLDARNYFSPTRGEFDQNQFGGTIGGPIRKNKLFFFADYQGTRLTQGLDTGQIPVPSLADRNGNLMDVANSFVTVDQNGKPVPTTVSGPYWANQLAQKLGYGVRRASLITFRDAPARSSAFFPSPGFPPVRGPLPRRLC